MGQPVKMALGAMSQTFQDSGCQNYLISIWSCVGAASMGNHVELSEINECCLEHMSAGPCQDTAQADPVVGTLAAGLSAAAGPVKYFRSSSGACLYMKNNHATGKVDVGRKVALMTASCNRQTTLLSSYLIHQKTLDWAMTYLLVGTLCPTACSCNNTDRPSH